MKELRTFLQEDGTRRYTVKVPDFIAEHEDFPHWEKDRLLSMEMNLKQGDVLFDVGAELGWQSAIYAQFVGAQNMCLFEPAAELWSTIQSIWLANELDKPRTTCCALVSNRSAGHYHVKSCWWPEEVAMHAPLQSYDNWAAIHSFLTEGRTGEISIDDYVILTGNVPNAITMDIEGAEKRALEGARLTLCNHRPLVWVSIHPEVRLKKYDTSRQEILDFMGMCNYCAQYLGVDHEEHYLFYPYERRNEVALVQSPWMTNGKRDMYFEQAIPNWEDPWKVEKATWGVK